MQLGRFDGHRVGLLDGTDLIDVTPAFGDHGHLSLPWPRLSDDLAEWRGRIRAAARDGERTPVELASLDPPVLNPSKVIGVAGNFAAHNAEMRAFAGNHGADTDLFLIASSSIVGPGADVRLPPVDGEVHFEGELALVVGRGGRHISERDALDHVFGFTAALDMTLRGAGDRSRRKSYDGFTPLGPWLTTWDEAAEWEDLTIRAHLNGELRQSARVAEMIWALPAIVARSSEAMTLVPGDVILTGSPAGVGRVLPGDRVSVEIGTTGALHITIVGPEHQEHP